ncbi:MAG: ABC transporter permease, partial [Anaerolineae bacterium]|nr:ABC transporter permease [Anaerolineae bacterium]
MKVQSAEAAKTRSLVSRRLEAQSGLLAIFLVLILLIILSSIISPTFRTGLNVQNVSRQAVALGLVSLGQTFVILGGGIDLSAGSVISLVSCLSAGIMMGQPERLAPVLLGMVLLGTLIGVFYGLLVTRLRVAPFIVTLGTMSIVQGLVFLYTKNPVGKIPKAFRFLAEGQIGPIPFPVILFAVLTLISLFVLRR